MAHHPLSLYLKYDNYFQAICHATTNQLCNTFCPKLDFALVIVYDEMYTLKIEQIVNK